MLHSQAGSLVAHKLSVMDFFVVPFGFSFIKEFVFVFFIWFWSRMEMLSVKKVSKQVNFS
jgi:hypothetical protein